MGIKISRRFSQYLALALPVDWKSASNDFRRYFSNTGWLVFEKVFASTISFAVGIYVVRFLGPTNFGMLSYAISFVSLFAGIAALGLDGIVIRDLVRYKEDRDDLLGTSFLLKLLGALLTIVIISLVILWTPQDRSANLLILLIAFASVFKSIFVIDLYFQSKVLSKYPVLVRCFCTIVSTLFKVVLIYLQAPLIWFAFAITLENVIIAIGFVFVYREGNLKLNLWRFKRTLAFRLLRDSWPLILSNVAVAVYMRIDQVMVKGMLDAKALGLYAVAVNLTEIWHFIPTIIVGSLFPAIINAKKNDYKLYVSGLQRLHDMLFFIAFIIGIIVSFGSGQIISLLFGELFIAARIPLIVSVWSVVFVFQGVIRGHFLIVENEQRLGLWFRVIALLVNVGLNFLLIPWYGIVGAAIATLVSYSLPVYVFSLFHPVLRLNLLMCLRSYIFPFRLIYYGRGIFK